MLVSVCETLHSEAKFTWYQSPLHLAALQNFPQCLLAL